MIIISKYSIDYSFQKKISIIDHKIIDDFLKKSLIK